MIGIACAVTWVIIESCILVTGTVKTRSKMLAVYMTTYYLETVRKQDIVAMNQTMLLVNTLGSLIAPTIIAITMDQFGHHYLFISFAIISLYFIWLLFKSLLKNREHHHAGSF